MTKFVEKFCLKWNDFQKNINTSYMDFRKHGDFSDVTLMCEEDQKFEAHRVILSACSPFFMNVFKKNKHNHPWIYMKGLKAKDLDAIIDFIYYGEVNIFQEDLNNFLTLAEDLQLKGLGGELLESPPSENLSNPKLTGQKPEPPVRTSSLRKRSSVLTKDDDKSPSSDITIVENFNPTSVSVTNTEKLDIQLRSMMELSSRGWHCTVCGKAMPDQFDVRCHIETSHIQGFQHRCEQCGKISLSKPSLMLHIKRNHANVNIPGLQTVL